MKYLLLLCADETTPEVDVSPGCHEWSAALRSRGALVTTLGLHPPEPASTVRVRGEEILLTDGPFAETKEQVGGLSVIECDSPEEARRIAAAHPWARIGTVEVRRILE
jgi:hypothetical protein